ncbi:MAG: hypothetical protein ACP5FZ_01285 [Fidelibacterota bacterium]
MRIIIETEHGWHDTGKIPVDDAVLCSPKGNPALPEKSPIGTAKRPKQA